MTAYRIEKMIVANRLYIPENTKAILWDMDGVLLDTLSFDLTICNQLIHEHIGGKVDLTRGFIRSIFAYHPLKFWQLIFEFIEKEYNLHNIKGCFDLIFHEYNQARNNSVFEVNPGIPEILECCINMGIKAAVVSNNPTKDLKKILSQSGIFDFFNIVVGNDICELKKKPAPDTYLYTARLLSVKSDQCVVVEDSVLGAEAGYHANCFTVGVATGGDNFEKLEQSQWVNRVYSSFQPNYLNMQFGRVKNKYIYTPNDFISHMVEHIAWRIGCEINLYWNNNDWFQLGKTIGKNIKNLDNQERSGVALGMIDDGSAEVLIELSDVPSLEIDSIKHLDLDWFLSLKCEQVHSGEPLVELIKGLTHGLKSKIYIRVCNVEDPHHTWEGIFRSIGIALNQMYTPKISQPKFEPCKLEKEVSSGDVSIEARSANLARVSRKTAESNISILVDFTKQNHCKYSFNVSSTINVTGLQDILDVFAKAAGFTLQIDFNAKVLGSSHVVLEDTGLVLGRSLKEIFALRMEHYGVNGSGSSLKTVDDLKTQSIRVGISIEGRKFWKIVPFFESYDLLKRKFIIGQNVSEGLLSEDLDDFLDGLSGGLGCSIVIHIKELIEPDDGWQMIFKHLGKALKEAFSANPYRKGVPPGVKATLY